MHLHLHALLVLGRVKQLGPQIEPVIKRRDQVARILVLPQILVAGETVSASQLLLVAVEACIMWEVWQLEMYRAESNKLLKIRLVRPVDALFVLAKHERAQLVEVVPQSINDRRVAKDAAVREHPDFAPFSRGLELRQVGAVESRASLGIRMTHDGSFGKVVPWAVEHRGWHLLHSRHIWSAAALGIARFFFIASAVALVTVASARLTNAMIANVPHDIRKQGLESWQRQDGLIF